MQITIGNRDAKQKHEKHQRTNSPSPAEHAKQHETNTTIKQLSQRHNSNKIALITKAPFCLSATLFRLALASWTCWVSEHPYSRNTKAILLFWQLSPQKCSRVLGITKQNWSATPACSKTADRVRKKCQTSREGRQCWDFPGFHITGGWWHKFH